MILPYESFYLNWGTLFERNFMRYCLRYQEAGLTVP